jgi:hypothetical protein
MGAQGSKPQPTSPDLGRRRFLVRLPNRDGFVPDPRPDVGKLAKPPKR